MTKEERLQVQSAFECWNSGEDQSADQTEDHAADVMTVMSAIPELLEESRQLARLKEWLTILSEHVYSADPAEYDTFGRHVTFDQLIVIKQIEEVLAGKWEPPTQSTTKEEN